MKIKQISPWNPAEPAQAAPKLLTTNQVLKLLDVSRGTLYRLENEGKLKPVEFEGNKILKHRRVRFASEDVETFMREAAYERKASKQ